MIQQFTTNSWKNSIITQLFYINTYQQIIPNPQNHKDLSSVVHCHKLFVQKKLLTHPKMLHCCVTSSDSPLIPRNCRLTWYMQPDLWKGHTKDFCSATAPPTSGLSTCPAPGQTSAKHDKLMGQKNYTKIFWIRLQQMACSVLGMSLVTALTCNHYDKLVRKCSNSHSILFCFLSIANFIYKMWAINEVNTGISTSSILDLISKIEGIFKSVLSFTIIMNS